MTAAGLFGAYSPSALCARRGSRCAPRAAGGEPPRPRADNHDVEMLDPHPTGFGNHMPVIARLQVDQLRAPSGVTTSQLPGLRVSGSQALNWGFTA